MKWSTTALVCAACRLTFQTASTVRRATSWTRIRSSIGSRPKAAAVRTTKECEKREDAGRYLFFGGLLAVLGLEVEGGGAANDFFERDAGRVVFDRGGVYARARAALALLSALRGQNNQTVFGINFL